MSSAGEISKGRAQLRDMGPAGGSYEADYTIHSSTQNSKHIGFKSTTHKVSSADIRLVNGYSLKNGVYMLEKDGQPVCKLRKMGAIWQVITDE